MALTLHKFVGQARGLGRGLRVRGTRSKSASTLEMRILRGRWTTTLSASPRGMAGLHQLAGPLLRIGWRR